MSFPPSDVLPQLELLPSRDGGPIVVNERLVLHEMEGQRVAMVMGLAVFWYHCEDRVAEDLFVAQAQENEWAKASELAAALGRGIRSLQRRRARYVAEGAEGVVPEKRGPKGARLGDAREGAIRRWHAEGVSGREMARRLKVAPGTVQSAIRRLKLKKPDDDDRQEHLVDAVGADVSLMEGTQAPEDSDPAPGSRATPVDDEEAAVIPVDETDVEGGFDAVPPPAPAGAVPGASSPSPSPAPVPSTLDTDPMNRSIDRMLASQGRHRSKTAL